MDDKHNFGSFEEVKEAYSGLGLDENQIWQAERYGLTPEQIRETMESLNRIFSDIKEAFAIVVTALQESFKCKEMQEFIKSLENYESHPQMELEEPKYNKKGKSFKTWQKNNFYQ